MMKKTIVLMFGILLCCVFCLSSCGYSYEGFKTIHLKYGTLRIPADWSYQDDDGQAGIFCKDTLCAFKSASYPGYKGEMFPEGISESNAYSDKFKALYIISNSVLSNGVIMGETRIKKGNTEEDLYYMNFLGTNSSEILWYFTPDVPYATIEAIANSFA